MQVDSAPVIRRIAFVIAVVALLWQGVAGATLRQLVDAAADAEHAALHLENVGHHHHDDGGYHADDTMASAAHLALDASHAQPGVVVAAQQVWLPAAGASPPAFCSAFLPSPHLPPLLRPPRTLA